MYGDVIDKKGFFLAFHISKMEKVIYPAEAFYYRRAHQ